MSFLHIPYYTRLQVVPIIKPRHRAFLSYGIVQNSCLQAALISSSEAKAPFSFHTLRGGFLRNYQPCYSSEYLL